MKAGKDESGDNPYIPLKERKKIRNKLIVAFYRSGLSMNDVVAAMKKQGYGVSKTTVFFAVNGRWTKKAAERRRVRNKLKNKTIK